MWQRRTLGSLLEEIPTPFCFTEKWEQFNYYTLTLKFRDGAEFKIQMLAEDQIKLLCRAKYTYAVYQLAHIMKLRAMYKIITSKVVKEHIVKLKATKNGN